MRAQDRRGTIDTQVENRFERMIYSQALKPEATNRKIVRVASAFRRKVAGAPVNSYADQATSWTLSDLLKIE
jgi:hypothetical protein